MQINTKTKVVHYNGTENIFVIYQNIEYVRCTNAIGEVWWVCDDKRSTNLETYREKELEQIYTKTILRMRKLQRIL